MAKHAEISSQSPHFFRIILPHVLEDGTLELHRNFVKEHWKHLFNYASLKVPNGVESRIELKKSNGRAWLDKGWRDFVEKYSIKCGYFLVFKYEGESRFNVLIFDLSTKEIEYPITSYRKTRESEGNAKERVIQRAKTIHTQNFHFTVIMKPAYVNSNSYLHIPKDAARSYFREGGNRNISLKLNRSYGRVWPVKCIIGARPHRVVRIGHGWNKFSQENHLQKGDKCVFELVNSTDEVFKVTIFRVTEEKSTQSSASEMQMRKRKRTDIQRDEDCKSKEPCFTVVMRKSYVKKHCRLVIPRVHALRYLMDQNQKEVLLHRVDGEVWLVKCSVCGFNIYFLTGWMAFVVDNDLQEEDTCVFELFGQGPNHYNVTIIRAVES